MFSPNQPVYDEGLLIRYLLGSLSGDETERLDELSIADDEFNWRLREAENDLIDGYVRGELSGEILERFRSFYLSSPARREKVELARALQDGLSRAGNTRSPRRVTWRGLDFPRWIPVAGLAAMASLVVLAGGYLLYHNFPSRPAMETRQQPPSVKEPGRTALPERGVVTLALVLPPRRRGAADSPASVTVPPHAQTVAVRLELESDEFPEYRAALQDPPNRTVWRSGLLEPAPGDDRRIVSFGLPASLLKQQNYVLEFYGIPASGAAQLAGSYPLAVTIAR